MGDVYGFILSYFKKYDEIVIFRTFAGESVSLLDFV